MLGDVEGGQQSISGRANTQRALIEQRGSLSVLRLRARRSGYDQSESRRSGPGGRKRCRSGSNWHDDRGTAGGLLGRAKRRCHLQRTL